MMLQKNKQHHHCPRAQVINITAGRILIVISICDISLYTEPWTTDEVVVIQTKVLSRPSCFRSAIFVYLQAAGSTNKTCFLILSAIRRNLSWQDFLLCDGVACSNNVNHTVTEKLQFYKTAVKTVTQVTAVRRNFNKHSKKLKEKLKTFQSIVKSL